MSMSMEHCNRVAKKVKPVFKKVSYSSLWSRSKVTRLIDKPSINGQQN